MSNMKKIAVPTFILFLVFAAFILSPTDELGSFDSVRSGGEINQTVNVTLNKAKNIERDRMGRVVAFYALDKSNDEAIVKLNEPVSIDLEKAVMLELFGHMHGSTFVATSVTIKNE